MIMSRADAGIYVIVYQTEFLVEEREGGQRKKRIVSEKVRKIAR